MGVPTEHAAQHSRRDGEIARAKKYPFDANRGISGEAGEYSPGQLIRPRSVLKKNANDALNDKIRAVEQAPHDERPCRAMPEAAQKHDDHQIHRGAKRPDLIAAERNVKVIPQEGG